MLESDSDIIPLIMPLLFRLFRHFIFKKRRRLNPKTMAQKPSPPRRDSRFHLRDWRYAAISLGARVDVRGDTPMLKAIEPPPSVPPTPRRYAGGWRGARPTHPSLVADGRHPPRERRAVTPSQGRAILGSLCPPSRQMACLSSSYTARERNVLLLTDTQWCDHVLGCTGIGIARDPVRKWTHIKGGIASSCREGTTAREWGASDPIVHAHGRNL
jgi:hypothetical protein